MVTKVRQERTLNSSFFVLLGTVLLVAGVGFWFLFLRGPAQSGQQGLLTTEGKAYVKHLALADVEMKATESYMGSRLVEITGKITNKGDRALRLIEINCIFFDPYNQLVLRERVPIVRQSGAGFAPGESRTFRLPFDSIPSTWNQALPQLVIARVDFSN